jgi:hypothetical protein
MSATREGLHAVATYVLAGPQYDTAGTIRLRAEDDGITTVAEPRLLLTGGGVVGPDGHAVPLTGHTARTLAFALGLEARTLEHVYPDQPAIGIDHPLDVDPDEAAHLVSALASGTAALERLGAAEAPVLWPEHFDVGVSIDEVNFGVSPGDGGIPEPYAYVGPWSPPEQDDFWNQAFGAARTMAELGGIDEVLAFFREGQARLTGLDG